MVCLIFPSLEEFSTVCCDPHSPGFGEINKAEVDVFILICQRADRMKITITENVSILAWEIPWQATVHGIFQARVLEWGANVDHNKLWKILHEMGIPDHLTCLLRNLCAVQEATFRTGHTTMDWFQIGKGVH